MKNTLIVIFIIVSCLSFASQTGTLIKSKKLYLRDNTTAVIYISYNGTAVSFPVKPEKISFGNKNAFGVEFVGDDVILSPMKPKAKTHMFVYLDGRRRVFDLRSSRKAYSLVQVFDQRESLIRPKMLRKRKR